MAVLLSGNLTAVGASASTVAYGYFNASVSGTFVGTVQLQRKLPGQASFNTVTTYTTPTEAQDQEIEDGTEYRFNCSAYTSGTITYRLSQGSNKFMQRG